ncbi:unnamed protein product [marine sediment metagenome]|uniref:Holin n=1 Tax=marine sediment metagenome TaxID=412755 RepID=X1CNI0_9ZZZZ
MTLRSKIQTWFDGQTSMDKLAWALIPLSFPVVDVWSAFQFLGALVLTGWVVYDKHRHEQKRSSFT